MDTLRFNLNIKQFFPPSGPNWEGKKQHADVQNDYPKICSKTRTYELTISSGSLEIASFFFIQVWDVAFNSNIPYSYPLSISLSLDIFTERNRLSGVEEFHSQRGTVAFSVLGPNNLIVSAQTQNNRSIDFNSPAGILKLCLNEN